MQPKKIHSAFPRDLTVSEKAILTTILYSDIFSFPLTKDELWKFLIAEKKISRDNFGKSLDTLKKLISHKQGYYCLAGREETIAKRIQNAPEVAKKVQLAQMIAHKLCVIPSIRFIGISGGLAAGNAERDDDVDFVIIVAKDTLFESRLLILGLLQRLGVRRKRNQKYAANSICVNLLLDETALNWFEKYKDIYTAREIAQIVPLFERDRMYNKFLTTNSWIQDFLPNISLNDLQFNGKNNKGNRALSRFIFNPFFETLTRFLQMSLINRHRSIETITDHVLAFHPHDYRIDILKQLRLKMRRFGLLTKN